MEHPFRYSLAEDEVGLIYKVFNVFMVIFSYISILIISIACLGLMGMLAFTVRSRQKEISIRKVMGANVKTIAWILSKEFIRIVIIAIILAIPVVYLIASQIQMLVPASIGFDPVAILIGSVLLVSFNWIKHTDSNNKGS